VPREDADSFYFIALLNANDPAHQRIAQRSEKAGWKLVTTRWVLAEVADGLSAPTWRERVVTLFDRLERQADVVIHSGSDTLFARGLEIYRDRRDKAWSLTDCISFAVIRQEGLQEALTGDRHFAQAGFIALLAE
jgi:predicted nucleic acid-binding protein